MYAIKLLPGKEAKRDKTLARLIERLQDPRIPFEAQLETIELKGCPSIKVSRVRLKRAKPYCGNHPGTCEVDPFTGKEPKRKKARFLEWDDWVRFHRIVNAALNRFRAHADVWSNPHDVRGKMWIRKGTKPRRRWDWTEQLMHGRTVRIWNQGTADQFD